MIFDRNFTTQGYYDLKCAQWMKFELATNDAGSCDELYTSIEYVWLYLFSRQFIWKVKRKHNNNLFNNLSADDIMNQIIYIYIEKKNKTKNVIICCDKFIEKNCACREFATYASKKYE